MKAMGKMKMLLAVVLTMTIISGCGQTNNTSENGRENTVIQSEISANEVIELLKEEGIAIVQEDIWNPADFYGVSITFDSASIFTLEDESVGKVITVSNIEQLPAIQDQINIAGMELLLTNEKVGVLIILDMTIATESLEKIEAILNSL